MIKKILTLNPIFEECRLFTKNIVNHFNSRLDNIHKARNEIKVLKCTKYSVVVKFYKVPNLIRAFIYTYLRDSKAHKAYDNALKLNTLGINTPTPIAFVEEYDFLLKKSFFISKEFKFDFTLREPLEDINFIDRVNILKKFAHFSVDLHKNGILHQDYSPGNILIKKIENSYEFTIVDINRMAFKEIDFKIGCKNFSKLWADEDALEIIALEYAKEMNYDELKTVEYIIHLDNRHKSFKKNKYKIKNLFVSKEKRRYQ